MLRDTWRFHPALPSLALKAQQADIRLRDIVMQGINQEEQMNVEKHCTVGGSSAEMGTGSQLENY